MTQWLNALQKILIATIVLIMENLTSAENILIETLCSGGSLAVLTLTWQR
jgi:hypothetical protein